MDDDRSVSITGALRRLLAEIAVGDYRDSKGHVLTNNTAYIEAVTVLELNDLLGGEHAAPGGS